METKGFIADKAKGRLVSMEDRRYIPRPWRVTYDDISFIAKVIRKDAYTTKTVTSDIEDYLVYSDVSYWFDANFLTYGSLYVDGKEIIAGVPPTIQEGVVFIYLNVPMKSSEVKLFVENEINAQTDGPKISFYYEDGTYDFKQADSHNDVQFPNEDGTLTDGKLYRYLLDTSKRLILIYIEGKTVSVSATSGWGANIRGLYVNVDGEDLPISGKIQIEDSSGTVIDPAKEDTLRNVADELSLPNEDLYINTSPSASTDYAVAVDASRGDKITTALYADAVPSSVKIEGSNDGVTYFELDGLTIDLSTWSTAKYNIYEFEPYTRYFKVTLTTASSGTTRIDLSIRSVRT